VPSPQVKTHPLSENQPRRPNQKEKKPLSTENQVTSTFTKTVKIQPEQNKPETKPEWLHPAATWVMK